MNKVKGLYKRKEMVTGKLAIKLPCQISYRWDDFTLWDSSKDGDPKDFKPSPKFSQWRGSQPFEDWPLELIRRKFYFDLREATDYQRDCWMTKVMGCITWILERELVSLYELALFFGMPRRYLANLSRRDPGFRLWIKWLRLQTPGYKAERARLSKLYGEKTILLLMKPHWNGKGSGSNLLPFAGNVDVGWKPKTYSRNR